MTDYIPRRHLIIVEPGKVAITKHGYLHDDNQFAAFIKEIINYYSPETRVLVADIPDEYNFWVIEASEWLFDHEMAMGIDPIEGEDED